MDTDRRDFLGTLLAAGVVVGADPHGSMPAPSADLPWLKRIRGRHRAVFDNPSDANAGVIRAWIWQKQCRQAFGAKASDCSAVVVARHGGISTLMDDAFWEKYELTQSPSTPEKPNIPKHNPAMAAYLKEALASSPPPARAVAEGAGVDSLIENGGIVVGCEFAFWFMISRIMTRDKVEESVARERAMSHLIPGATIVPSGFFALAAAQNAGCAYVTNV
ncbi:MAG: hypothetical protein HOP28_14335 [Gemmatimonadales bacterium]|nr:hypothetical protein [Gemmatimonadales bacterium]